MYNSVQCFIIIMLMVHLQLQLYATSQSVMIHVNSAYLGAAVKGDTPVSVLDTPSKCGIFGHGVVLLVFNNIPFIVTLVLAIAISVGFICFVKDPNPLSVSVRKSLEESVKNHKSRVFAIILICSYGTLFVFATDAYSLYVDATYEQNLPKYFKRGDYYCNPIWLNCFCSIIFLLLGIVAYYAYSKNNSPMYACLGVLLCISSTLLELTFHIPSILTAWTVVPSYARSVFAYYGVIVIVFVGSIIFTLKVSSTLKWCTLKRTCGILILVTIVDVILLGAMAGLIACAPVSRSIEGSADGLTTMYQGTLLLSGGVIVHFLKAHGWL